MRTGKRAFGKGEWQDMISLPIKQEDVGYGKARCPEMDPEVQLPVHVLGLGRYGL